MNSVTATITNNLKKVIDQDISSYSQQLEAQTYEQYGQYPLEAVKAFTELLSRGGKRIRGQLAVNAYNMLGGSDEQVTIHIARTVEMLHAYILMVDDIQDRSEVRRGGPTAHVLLSHYHREHHLKDDSDHFGASIAMNGLLVGAHSAIDVIAKLNVDSELRLRAIQNINKHFIATAHGQSLDIFNEVIESVDETAVNKVLLWKTAYYTFMNPLQLGAIIAGADDNDLLALEQYSLHAGRVYQITDDILGIFGTEEEAGKSPFDDIKEGKRTILTVKALEIADSADSYFLSQMLGNKKLTQAEFERCKEIITNSGALDYAKRQAGDSLKQALIALDQAPKSWNSTNKDFLTSLVTKLIDRKS